MLRKIGENLHFALTILLAIGLVPALLAAKLPIRFDWPRLLETFWLGLNIQSVFFASLLYIICFPIRETIQPLWRRYWNQKVRFLILFLLFVQLYLLFGLTAFLFLSVVAVAILELAERTRNQPGGFGRALFSFLIPATYWFIGLFLVFILNQAVIAVRPHRANDAVLNRLDSWILFGATVSELAHKAFTALPLMLYRFLDLLYFAMFAQAGGALIIIGLRIGRERALQFVATVLTAGYIALAIYFLWPSLSPFYTCPAHFEILPKALLSYSVQQQLLAYVTLLREGGKLGEIGTGYFIAFPCMHIATPVVALWFLRQWRRLAVTLLGLDILLCAAIVLLEYHYVVDLIGGVAVAALAIAMVDGRE
ncbi:MAG: phosphatase PAP2 family protein [Acidobacteriia bacterium]|nr:phosphatase PAP2 family protein [Terriglobia bacterium]